MTKRMPKDIASPEFASAVSEAVQRAVQARQATASAQPAQPAAIGGPIIVGFAQAGRAHTSESMGQTQQPAK